MKMTNKEMAERNFEEFQYAIKKQLITCEHGDVHNDLFVYVDAHDGVDRYTYGILSNSSDLQASCVFVSAPSYKGKPCFSTGVATKINLRRRGVGKQILGKSIDELKNGLKSHGINEFYVEMQVDQDNEASHRLCEPFCDEIIDKGVGKIYLKLIR
jgi:ribosomal protein S18 acetylase RimI-like enzyme